MQHSGPAAGRRVAGAPALAAIGPARWPGRDTPHTLGFWLLVGLDGRMWRLHRLRGLTG